MKTKKKYGILSAYGHLWLYAKTKKVAEKIFQKDFDIKKYPVNELK